MVSSFNVVVSSNPNVMDMEANEQIVNARTQLFERAYELGLTIDMVWSENSRIKILEGNTVLNIEEGNFDDCVDKSLKYLEEL
jgi:hypothetical protein